MHSDKYTRSVQKKHTFYELANLNYIFVPHETFNITNELDYCSDEEVEYLGHDDVCVTVSYLTGRLKGQVIKVYDRSILYKKLEYQITFQLDKAIYHNEPFD